MLAIDLSPTLVDLARERQPRDLRRRHASTSAPATCSTPALGRFDYVVGMDSLIHYERGDAVRVLAGLAQRTRRALLFTFAPSSPALAAMRAVGQLFPRGDRAPADRAGAPSALHRRLDARRRAAGLARAAAPQRIASGFYTSQALELVQR